MINFRNANIPGSLFGPERWLGKLVRAPLRLIPPSTVLPILQGPGRGLRWIVGSYNHGCWLGSYEYEKQLAIRALVGCGDVVYDVGAHVGYFTIILARLVGPTGMVYSFEPAADNHAYLLKHLALNGITNVVAVRAAIGPTTGTGRLQRGRDNSSGRLAAHEGAECPMYNLPEYIVAHHLRSPSLIKIDIEGEEASVVPGVVDSSITRRARLLISTHSADTTRSLMALLSGRGFQVTPLQWARAPGGAALDSATLILASP